MAEKIILRIILIVFFSLFWYGISFLTNSNYGIYAGLASIYAALLVTLETK